MARRKKKKKRAHDYSQDLLLILTGSVLTLCALSVMYGFLIRKSMANVEFPGFRIEILNGTGQKGLARRVAVSLMKKGIDVFHVDNADNFSYEETILIGRRKVDDLDDVADALGCKNVVEQFKKDSLVDATLIIGADYLSLKLGDETNSNLLD